MLLTKAKYLPFFRIVYIITTRKISKKKGGSVGAKAVYSFGKFIFGQLQRFAVCFAVCS